MGNGFKDVRAMLTLTIPTARDMANVDAVLQRFYTEAGMIQAQILKKPKLVWANTMVGTDILQCHTRFAATPVDDPTLAVTRNTEKLKHVMIGTKLWNCSKSEFHALVF